MRFADSSSVLISRCAWHRRYYGYTKIIGVSRWQGRLVAFTDGICQNCAARVRSDFQRGRAGVVPVERPSAWLPGLAAVGLAVVAALVLVARPTHDVPVPAEVALRPPEWATRPSGVVPPSSGRVARSRPAMAPPSSASVREPSLIRAWHVSERPVDQPRVSQPRVREADWRPTTAFRVTPPRESAESP